MVSPKPRFGGEDAVCYLDAALRRLQREGCLLVTGEADARVELRRRDGLVPERRWHVPDRDVTSGWTRL